MGNNAYLLKQIAAGEKERARQYVAWLLGATKGYSVKIVNPGGVELWKENVREVRSLDDAVGDPKVTPRAILETLTEAANELNLPHPVHIHCNNLGQAGNIALRRATTACSAGNASSPAPPTRTAWRSTPAG